MLITEHKGKITTFKDANYEDNNAYVFYVNRNHVIDAREQLDAVARFANDARGIKRIVGFTNNAEYVVIDKRVYITAIKDIQPNEEIFVGYGKDYWDAIKQIYKAS